MIYLKKYLKYKQKYNNLKLLLKQKGGYLECNNLKNFIQYGGICFMHSSLILFFFDDIVKSNIFTDLLIYNKSTNEFGVKSFFMKEDKITNIIYHIILEYMIQNLNKNILNPDKFSFEIKNNCSKSSQDFNDLIRLVKNLGQSVDETILERKIKKSISLSSKSGGFPFEFSFKFINHFNLSGSVSLNKVVDLSSIKIHSCIISKKGHACVLFKCNNQWIFYDSNIISKGIIKSTKTDILSIGDFFDNIEDNIFDGVNYIKNEGFFYRKMIREINKGDFNKLFEIINLENYEELLIRIVTKINLSPYKNDYYSVIYQIIQEIIKLTNKNIQAFFYLFFKNLLPSGILKSYRDFIPLLKTLDKDMIDSIILEPVFFSDSDKKLINDFLTGINSNIDSILMGNRFSTFSFGAYANSVEEDNVSIIKKFLKNTIEINPLVDDFKTVIDKVLNEFVINHKYQSQLEYFNSVFIEYVSFNFMEKPLTLNETDKIFNQEYFESLIPESHYKEYSEIKDKFPNIFVRLY
jgi:hypothetical protein